MKRFTDKTIRTEQQWVKITRDNRQRSFTFAKGYKGNFTAHQIETLTFKWVANWADAVDHANRMMTYA